MQNLTVLFFFALPLFVAIACRAVDTAPASQPAGLTSSIAISTDTGCIAQITISNNTNQSLSLGHYLSYALVRTDATPPETVAASPAHAMMPMFRILIQPGDSRTSKMTLSEKSLPVGHYRFTITYPTSIFSDPLVKDFAVPPPATTRP